MFCEDPETIQALNALEMAVLGRRRPLVVWLGAGASAWVGYPLWGQLADQMHQRFAREVGGYAKETASSLLAKEAYPALFEEMKRSDSALYFSQLSVAFAYRKPTPVYERMLSALGRIEPTYVLTTNVDESLERHLSGPELVQRSNVERLATLLGEDRAFICKLHGSISAAETMLFSAGDYDDLQTNRPFVSALRSVLADCSVLFVGYGLQDDHVIAALERGAESHPLFGTGPHFIVTPEGSSAPPADVHRISYRVDPPDHRSALLTLETIAELQACQSPVAIAAGSVETEQRDRDSVYFIGELLPWGQHTTSTKVTATSHSGTRELFVGEGYVDGEVVLDNYSALHDVVVGLICFDVACLSIDHLGRLHTLLGSFWFWRFVEVEAIQLIAPPDEPVVVFPEPGSLVGAIETAKLGSRSNTPESFEERTIAERIRLQLTPFPGKERIAEMQMERLASMIIDLTHALTPKQLGQMTRGSMVNPYVRRLLGISGGTPQGVVPRWLAFPVLRLAAVIRKGVICQHIDASATRLLMGSERLASVALAASSGSTWADDAASYALTGRFNSDLGALIEQQPELLEGVLRFRESVVGQDFRREIAERLAENEGGEVVAAVNSGLNEAIPPSVLQQAHDELSGLFLPRVSGATIRPAVWGDLRNGEARIASWRRRSRTLLDEMQTADGLKPYNLCPCGSGEKLRFCCLAALRD